MPHPFPPEAVPLLIDWYRAGHRDLPWRETRDPYAILVSEIMLQQTRAEAVKPYYHRFLATLPTVADLARADDALLHKLWEGLGYYSRVRNLKRAAITVMEAFGGVIPADFDALLRLPGVGRYTAGAVASIAYDIPVPAVDGNVLRVFSRLVGDDTDVLTPAAKTNAERAIAPYVPKTGAGNLTQALIELGAVVCTPGGSPKCADCPLSLLCVAAREGRQGELPVRNPKTKRRVECRTVLVIRTPDGRTALLQRPDRGLLAGLYEFPCMDGHQAEADVRARLESLGLSVSSVRPLTASKHLFTHIEWQMVGFAVEVALPDTLPEGWILATLEEIDGRYAIPSAYAAYRL